MTVSDVKISLRTVIVIAATRVLLALGALAFIAPPAHADALKVAGELGFLGEWKLTAELAEAGSIAQREFAGPFVLKHVGLCTHDGPEEKTGAMRVKLSAASVRLTATLLLDRKECTYSARKTDGYDGVLTCPGQPPIPLTLRFDAQEAGAARNGAQELRASAR